MRHRFISIKSWHLKKVISISAKCKISVVLVGGWPISMKPIKRRSMNLKPVCTVDMWLRTRASVPNDKCARLQKPSHHYQCRKCSLSALCLFHITRLCALSLCLGLIISVCAPRAAHSALLCIEFFLYVFSPLIAELVELISHSAGNV